MNTRLVNTAADVILAALTQNRTAAGIALALESACLLQSPETAAETEQLRARVAELEQLLAAKDRPADEDPIAFSLTVEASCGRALATGNPCPDHPKPQYAVVAAEDPHDSPLHHRYLVGRDMPEVRP